MGNARGAMCAVAFVGPANGVVVRGTRTTLKVGECQRGAAGMVFRPFPLGSSLQQRPPSLLSKAFPMPESSLNASPRHASAGDSLSELPLAALVVLTDGRIVEANHAATLLTGFALSELLDMPVQQLFGRETDQSLASDLAGNLAGNLGFAGELLCYQKSGVPFWNDMVVIPQRTAGDSRSLLVLMRDVTARRTAASALGVDVSHDRMILDRIQAAIVVHSATTEILYANALATEMLGVTYDSVLGVGHTDPRWKFFGADEELLPLSEFPVVKTLETKSAQYGLVVGARRLNDQEFRWAICNSYPVLDESGAIREVVVCFVDITELKNAQNALQKSEERLRLVLQGSNDAPWDWDLESNQLYYSPRWWSMIGYEPDELPNDSYLWARLMHPDDNTVVLERFNEWLRSETSTYEIEFRLRHKAGHYVSVLSRGFILRDEHGVALRVSGANSDITERRALEERLRQSQKMEAIGQLAGGVAHDFNNLLAVIVGNLELLRDAEPGSRNARDGLADALSAARRGADLTKRLLSFSRQQPLQSSAADVAQLVSNMGSVMRRIIPESIEIVVNTPPQPARIRIDAGLFENALLNLCINARDAMPNGGTLTLSVELPLLNDRARCDELDLAPGAYVCVAVSDTGTGMSAEVVRRSVEPFFTTKPVGSGTGLGLSMVYAFVRQSGGSLQIHSTPGSGSSVHLYFPAIGDPGLDTSDGATPETQEAALANQEVVLVVEDDASVRRLCVRTLRSLGYQPLEAVSGPEALRVLEQSAHVDLVLTDMVMPEGLTGKQLAERVQRQWPHMRILFMSGYTANVLDDKTLESHELLAKPFSVEQLSAALRRAFGKRSTPLT